MPIDIDLEGPESEELVVELDDSDMPLVLDEVEGDFDDDILIDDAPPVLEPVLPNSEGLIEIDVDGDGDTDIGILPGSDVVFEETEEGEPEERSWENDGDHNLFLPYIRNRLKSIPKHRGDTTIGCERAVAYLRRLDREISRAVHSDENNVIDEEEAEKIRDQIYTDIEKLEAAIDRLSKKKRKKTASVKFDSTIYARIARDGEPQYYARVESEDGESMLRVHVVEPSPEVVTAYLDYEKGSMKKEASSVTKIMLTVDPFLDEVSRLIIRAHVTHGRNLEEVYRFCAKKYDFTDRDHLAVHGLLRQKGLLLDKDFSKIEEEIYTGDDTFGTKIYPT